MLHQFPKGMSGIVAKLSLFVFFCKINLETMTQQVPPFVRDKHVEYIYSLDKKEKDTFEYYVTEHLRMSGVYWGTTAMDLLKQSHRMDRERIVKFVLACQNEDGGFGGNVGHDSHLLYTLSAIQILATYDALDQINADKIADCKSF
jgi:geranylgeranyl transferase type-2 subunit beta